MLFAAALSIGTGFIFGLFPALHSTRPDLASTLKNQAGQPGGAKAAELKDEMDEILDEHAPDGRQRRLARILDPQRDEVVPATRGSGVSPTTGASTPSISSIGRPYSSISPTASSIRPVSRPMPFSRAAISVFSVASTGASRLAASTAARAASRS